MRRFLPTILLAVSMTVPVPAARADCTTPVDGMPAGPPAAAYHCKGVRTGMAMLAYSKRLGHYSSCGASAAFRDQFGNRYLATVGTCVLDYECLEDVVTSMLPPPVDKTVRDAVCIEPTDSEEELYDPTARAVPVFDEDLFQIGGMVYAVNKDDVNFAVVRIDRRRRLDPSVPVYGGPTRLGPPPSSPAEARVYSQYKHPFGPNARGGVVWGDARAARVVTDETFSTGGSVMLPDGTLVGYLGHGMEGGYNVSLFGRALERTFRRTGLRLTLMTAPLAK